MKKGSLILTVMLAVTLSACATNGGVAPVHNFDTNTDAGGVTITAKEKCHGGNDILGGGVGGLVFGPIGFVVGLVAGEWYSHKECK